MNKSRTRVRRSPEQWRELFRELESSKLDRRTFCQRKGLRMEALRRAQYRLSSRLAPVTPFVELMPPGHLSAAGQRGWEIELELGDGLVLRLARR